MVLVLVEFSFRSLVVSATNIHIVHAYVSLPMQYWSRVFTSYGRVYVVLLGVRALLICIVKCNRSFRRLSLSQVTVKAP